jgi:hypothetical protein
MARAQLILETVGLSRERQDELIAEAQAFKRVCRVIANRIPGCLVVARNDHREAA